MLHAQELAYNRGQEPALGWVPTEGSSVNLKKWSLLLVAVALLSVGPALAVDPDEIQKINLFDIKYGEFYYKSDFLPGELGPVDMPRPRPQPDIRPVGRLETSRVQGPEGASVTSAPTGAVPISANGTFMGGAGLSSADPIRDTERRLRKMIRRLDG